MAFNLVLWRKVFTDFTTFYTIFEVWKTSRIIIVHWKFDEKALHARICFCSSQVTWSRSYYYHIDGSWLYSFLGSRCNIQVEWQDAGSVLALSALWTLLYHRQLIGKTGSGTHRYRLWTRVSARTQPIFVFREWS